jgi:hypothetical protein
MVILSLPASKFTNSPAKVIDSPALAVAGVIDVMQGQGSISSNLQEEVKRPRMLTVAKIWIRFLLIT